MAEQRSHKALVAGSSPAGPIGFLTPTRKDKKMDRYDEAVAYFQGITNVVDFREAISHAWNWPSSVKGGCLFLFCTPDGMPRVKSGLDGTRCGCLTEVRAGFKIAWTTDLTNRIFADERIPNSAEDITPESLSVFAEWRRIIDKELAHLV